MNVQMDNNMRVLRVVFCLLLLCLQEQTVNGLRGNSLDRVLRYHMRTSKCKSRCLLRFQESPTIESCWESCASSNAGREEDSAENNMWDYGQRDTSASPGWDIFPLPMPSSDCESIGWGELIPNYNYIGDMKKRSTGQEHPANVYLLMGQDNKRKWHLLSSTWNKSAPYPKGDRRRLVLVVIDFFEGIKMKMRVPKCNEIPRRAPVKRSQFGMLKTDLRTEEEGRRLLVPKDKLLFLGLIGFLGLTMFLYALLGTYRACRPKSETLIPPELI